MTNDRFLTIDEVAERLQVSPYSARKFIKDGLIKAFKVGGTLGNKPDRRRLRVYESDLQAYIKKNEVKS